MGVVSLAAPSLKGSARKHMYTFLLASASR